MAKEKSHAAQRLASVTFLGHVLVYLVTMVLLFRYASVPDKGPLDFRMFPSASLDESARTTQDDRVGMYFRTNSRLVLGVHDAMDRFCLAWLIGFVIAFASTAKNYLTGRGLFGTVVLELMALYLLCAVLGACALYSASELTDASEGMDGETCLGVPAMIDEIHAFAAQVEDSERNTARLTYVHDIEFIKQCYVKTQKLIVLCALAFVLCQCTLVASFTALRRDLTYAETTEKQHTP